MFRTIPNQLTRRDILRGSTTLSALALFTATGGCEAFRNAIATRPVRRRVGTAAAATDVATYDAAVAAMKALPGNDPRNWTNQANIHLNFCPHGNWYFLPWHRAYLLYFEQICANLTGVDDFALPYWNWQLDRQIPAPFWAGALNHAPRSAGPNSQAGLSYIGANVIEGIMDLSNFEQFASYESNALRNGTGGGYGELEATPHNSIHGFVGGTMASFTSPLDPVFWCHHNMIDCMWDRWNNHLGNLNTSDTNWTQFNLSGMFVDGDGNAAEMTCGVTTVLPLITYRFDDSQKGDGNPDETIPMVFTKEVMQAGGNIKHQIRQTAGLGGRAVLRPGARLTRRAQLSDGMLNESVADGDGAGRLLVRLTGVHSPANDDTYLRVFVNLPNASAATPVSNPHYAGSVGFFTDPRRHGGMRHDHYIDISRTVARLTEAGMMAATDPIAITVINVAHEAGTRAPGPVRVGKIDLITTPVAIKGQ